jgi:hypothetical protein
MQVDNYDWLQSVTTSIDIQSEIESLPFMPLLLLNALNESNLINACTYCFMIREMFPICVT